MGKVTKSLSARWIIFELTLFFSKLLETYLSIVLKVYEKSEKSFVGKGGESKRERKGKEEKGSARRSA